MLALPIDKKYDIILVDAPWQYYGDPNKMGAAGKEYKLMEDHELADMRHSVEQMCHKKTVIYMWATSPRLDAAIDLMRAWGFEFRGVAFVWVKTRKDGQIIYGQGVRPSFTKPTTEFLLVGSRVSKGRPLPILDEGMGQVVLAPREGHSVKPKIFHEKIIKLHGEQKRIELFARDRYPGFDAWGDQLDRNTSPAVMCWDGRSTTK